MESDGANFHGWDIVESYPSNNGTVNIPIFGEISMDLWSKPKRPPLQKGRNAGCVVNFQGLVGEWVEILSTLPLETTRVY